MTRPRGWALAQVYDPELPIRGRYIAEQLQLPAEGFAYQKPQDRYQGEWNMNRQWAYLEVRDGQVIAKSLGSGAGVWIFTHQNRDGTIVALTEEPVLLFVSDNANIPALKAGQEMWVEVTLPATGPPRPIRIAVKADGKLTPLKVD
jgi:hypothetical protein